MRDIIWVHGWAYTPSIFQPIWHHLSACAKKQAHFINFAYDFKDFCHHKGTAYAHLPKNFAEPASALCMVTHSFGLWAGLRYVHDHREHGFFQQLPLKILAINPPLSFISHQSAIRRMLQKIARGEGVKVLEDFYMRFSENEQAAFHLTQPNFVALSAHLQAMYDFDQNLHEWQACLLNLPKVQLHCLMGTQDPFFDEVSVHNWLQRLAGQVPISVEMVNGGHVLPLTHAQVCADWVRTLETMNY